MQYFFHSSLTYWNVNDLSLSNFRHVQVSNEGAIGFYKRFGFEIIETKKQYYKHIEPADAYVLQKTLRHKKRDICV